MQILEGMIKPLREIVVKMKIKVGTDGNYQVFLTELQSIHKQMENVVHPALEALCSAESLDKSKTKPEEMKIMSERFSKQTMLLKHHTAAAKGAIARFNGILGVVPLSKP